MTPEVLIVGAGPTGLTAALSLARLGHRVRIIDRNSARSDKSKALGVQAGTLECLEAAIDVKLADAMVASGFRASEAWIHIEDGDPIRVDLRRIPSRHNYILILEQSETERILEESLSALGVRVERETELLELSEEGTEVVSTLRSPAGDRERVRTRFVIGCDGAHSTVRRSLELPFEGGQYTGDFILGDVQLRWEWPCDSIRTFVTSRGVIASFPMRGERKYRLILIPQSPATPKTPDITLDEFREILQHLSQGAIAVESATWLTRFRVHHRIVSRFDKGRIFLAGDAAHIHSPAGGQGMNTGIQDALNLTCKLHLALNGRKVSLERYTAERLPVARQVLRSTDFVFRMALLPPSLPVRWLRKSVLPWIVGSRVVQRFVATAISEIRPARAEIARIRAASRSAD